MAETYYAHRAQISFAEETTAGTTVSAPAHYPGHIPSMDFPDESVEWKTVKGIGAGRDFNAIAEGVHSFEGSADIILIKPDILFYGMGQVTEAGTDDSGGASTLDGAVLAGATVIDVVSSTSYAAGDFIAVGTDDTYPEIREIASVSSNEITLTKALRYAKATGKACLEVTSPYTHTMAVGDTLKSFTMEYGQDGATDIRRKINGCHINTMELSCEEEGMLKANIGIIGMNSTAADTSISTVTIPTTAPYMFDEGVITLHGGAIAQIKSFKLSINNNLKVNRYIQGTAARNVYEVVPGNRTLELTVDLVPQANTYTEKMRPEGQTATTLSAKFSRSATDYIDIQCTGVYIKDNKQPIPEEGEIIANQTMICKTCSIETKDTTPYYLMV